MVEEEKNEQETIPAIAAVITCFVVSLTATQFPAFAWTAESVADDPLVRMPGTQPGDVSLDDAGQWDNCHGNYDESVEPTHNWQGSMMAQSARDFLYLATMTVAAQDAIWAIGNPNATDICIRCHFPVGWLNERSDPTNASLMERGDIDGVQCSVCHYMFDPFFEETYAGTRESSDWAGYWDERGASTTPSATAADAAWIADRAYSANYDATNAGLLEDWQSELTLDLSTNHTIGFDNPAVLIDGGDRSLQMLQMSAVISDVRYSPASGNLSFEVRNQTGYKLISGFPEGRRLFVNIKYFGAENNLLREVNPYDETAGTLKGLGYIYTDTLPAPATLGSDEGHVDELVYEMHGSTTFTTAEGHETFHFMLSDGRYKDNRIPPKGFLIGEYAGEIEGDAFARLSEPVWHGVSAPDYFSAEEYEGGYDLVSMQSYDITVPDAITVEVTLNYQTTSREYIEFLFNEINGTNQGTLVGTDAGGDPPYLIQTDPFFDGLRAWGDTIWEIWVHNMNAPGAAPITIASGQWDTSSPTAVEITEFQGTSSTNLFWPILVISAILIGSGIALIFIRKRKFLANI